jgi:hypothetical protein
MTGSPRMNPIAQPHAPTTWEAYHPGERKKIIEEPGAAANEWSPASHMIRATKRPEPV